MQTIAEFIAEHDGAIITLATADETFLFTTISDAENLSEECSACGDWLELVASDGYTGHVYGRLMLADRMSRR